MAQIFDLYNYPEGLPAAKCYLELMEGQTRIVEGLEHAKERLSATTRLDSSTLAKCNVFVDFVNGDANGDLCRELGKLSMNELAFCSISFDKRKIKALVPHFNASGIRRYVSSSQISCIDRNEIFSRLNYLSAKFEGTGFHRIFTLATNAQPDQKPSTTALQPTAFELPTSRWENIDRVFPRNVAAGIRRAPQRVPDPGLTDCVRSKFPRSCSGDAFIWLDLDPTTVLPLLRECGHGIRVATIRNFFGDFVADAVEGSNLRSWERANGHQERTDCVVLKGVCHVELRIGYDTGIAEQLFK